VVYNGINLEGYDGGNSAGDRKSGLSTNERNSGPVVGYFARLCREKGLDTLVEAFIQLRKRDRLSGLRLSVAGSLGPADQSFVQALRQRLEAQGLSECVEFHANVDRETKVALLKSFSVFTVPARYGEAFGLYVIEALAAGVPVVQPNTAAFPELVELTGGGVLCTPDSSSALADAIENLLLDPKKAHSLAAAGRRTVFEQFNSETMARNFLEAVKSVECCEKK
jgi:glycosyltransferase involved in cell wall biosynthesis